MDYIHPTTLFPRSGDVIHPQLWESGSGYETIGYTLIPVYILLLLLLYYNYTYNSQKFFLVSLNQIVYQTFGDLVETFGSDTCTDMWE